MVRKQLLDGGAVLFYEFKEIDGNFDVPKEVLADAKLNPRPVVYTEDAKIYTFKVFHVGELNLNASLCQLLIESERVLILMDDYDYFLDELNFNLNLNDFIQNFLKEFLDDLYVNYFTLEDQLINLEATISSGSITNINLDMLSSIKHDCMMAEQATRRLSFIIQDILVDQKDTKRLNSSVTNNHDISVHLADYVQHLIILYNSIISERTNNTINRLTAITVFATPITILSGIYGMNFINMPGLKHQYGYYIMLGVMLLAILLIYHYLHKKKII